MRIVRFVFAALLVFSLSASYFSVSFADEKAVSDDEVRKLIIQESIASYPGNCPCPYNLARNGSRCGKRSAYSRPGGYSPLCYPSDVSAEMVNKYRGEHNLGKPKQ